MKFIVEIIKTKKDTYNCYINGVGDSFKTFSEIECYLKSIQENVDNACKSALRTFVSNSFEEKKGVFDK